MENTHYTIYATYGLCFIRYSCTLESTKQLTKHHKTSTYLPTPNYWKCEKRSSVHEAMYTHATLPPVSNSIAFPATTWGIQ